MGIVVRMLAYEVMEYLLSAEFTSPAVGSRERDPVGAHQQLTVGMQSDVHINSRERDYELASSSLLACNNS